MSTSLSVIVVSWRSAGTLAGCVRALLAHAGAAEIIVVDNAPPDAGRALHDRRESVRIVSRAGNPGFAAGCNAGAEIARGDRLLFLNPDVQVSPGSVQQLCRTLESHPEAGAVGGTLVDDSGEPQPRYAPRNVPGRLALLRRALLPGEPPPSRVSRLEPSSVEQVAGACLLVRREALRGIGGFDARFHPCWFEDVDLCLRLRQAGWKVLHDPAARFAHQGGHSVKQLDAPEYYDAWYRNLQRYGRKHHGAALGGALRLATAAGAALRLGGVLLPGASSPYGRGPRAVAYLQVFSRSILGWPTASPPTS